MGMLDDNYTSYIQSPVTADQLGKLYWRRGDKLAPAGAARNELAPYELVIDTTRGGVRRPLPGGRRLLPPRHWRPTPPCT